jgi:Ser/Thr protein kinase RdoA (MazF antagonist)
VIRGYPNRPSVLQGDILRLHLAGDEPSRFYIFFYRQGEQLLFKGRTEVILAHSRPLGPPDRDWNWPIYEYPIPHDWAPGAYVALFVPVDDADALDPARVCHSEAAALFVVRNCRPNAKTLYKLSLFTYHAYNEIGNPHGSLYTGGYNKITLHRPGGGVGGRPWDHYFPDYYDTSSPRQTFWHWDARFIRWLEREGSPIDYCTDLDLHENLGNCLAAYRLLLSVGHDEYWSEAMRRNLAQFVENGGNVAFLSGNTCWWRVHLAEGDTVIACDKTRHGDDAQKRDLWFRFDPENRLTGVSHRNGGGQWWGRREAVGYTVQHADHWVFEGTGLRDGDTFGAEHAVVGYECDGAAISDRREEQGFAVPRYDDGTPKNFTVLGIGRLGPDWAQDPEGYPGQRTATMGIYENNGVVFTAATTDWARVVDSGERSVEKITKNVLHRLGSSKVEHPAATAWKRVFQRSIKSGSIEILREGRKACIYRLHGAGPSGAPVIAKRCRSRSAEIEKTIYEEILPCLPISTLNYFGCVDESETEYHWFFVEDAGSQQYAHSIDEHRKLAARWLGQLHVSAASIPAVSRLPDRGAKHYLNHIRSSRELIQNNLDDPALNSRDLEILKTVLSRLDLLESRWDRLEEFYDRFPRTLVHCDLGKQNLRVRLGPQGIDLVAFDWEMAGYGIPAPDIAELSGRGIPRRCVDNADTELIEYWSVVRDAWSDLDLSSITALADVGALMRLVLAISWETLDIRRGWWPIAELDSYQLDFAAALERMELLH